MYIQGMFNQVVYWPTYTWSFLHVVIATIFICMYKELKDGSIDGILFDDTYDNAIVEYDEYEDDDESFQDFSQSE